MIDSHGAVLKALKRELPSTNIHKSESLEFISKTIELKSQKSQKGRERTVLLVDLRDFFSDLGSAGGGGGGGL